MRTYMYLYVRIITLCIVMILRWYITKDVILLFLVLIAISIAQLTAHVAGVFFVGLIMYVAVHAREKFMTSCFVCNVQHMLAAFNSCVSFN